MKGQAWLCMRVCCAGQTTRPAACKLRVTCEAAATLYGEHSISVQLDVARHSGSRQAREFERVTLSLGLCTLVCVCVCVCD